MATTMKASPRKFQESASAMLRNMAPLLAKARNLSFKKMLMPSPEVNHSNQQSELIKWQQEMFHRILNTMCLVQDGLMSNAELVELRKQIIQNIVAVHPNGEWADYTRDKLLFLQDLYQSRCISEEDYHNAKQPLMERLAEQGAQLGSQDFKFNAMELRCAVESRVAAAAAIAVAARAAPPPPPPFPQQDAAESDVPSPAAADTPGSATKKRTPIKHVMDAVARLKSPASRRKLELLFGADDSQTTTNADEEKQQQQHRVPHALDFVRPRACPTRQPPALAVAATLEGKFESPLFKQSNSGFARSQSHHHHHLHHQVPELASDTTDLLPQLSSLSPADDDDYYECRTSLSASSPRPVTQAKETTSAATTTTTLERSKSMTPSKLSFTPRSASAHSTPTKSPLGLSNSNSSASNSNPNSASKPWLPLSASPNVNKQEKTQLSRKFSGLLRGWQKVEADIEVVDKGSDEEVEKKGQGDELTPPKKNVWQKLDFLGGGNSSSSSPYKKAGGGGNASAPTAPTAAAFEDEDSFGKPVSDKDPLLSVIEDYPAEKINSGFIHGQGPNVKKLKKKVSVRAAPTNFFIDQVLGDNIKSELDRIRVEMTRSNPGSQTFTNDQIDAVATRLPVDKDELMRFFPKSWCDKYGDIVLEVVHREFRSHVSEMDGLRIAAKQKRSKSRMNSMDLGENDENRKSTDSGQPQTTAKMTTTTTTTTTATATAVATGTTTTHSPREKSGAKKKSTKAHVTKVYTTEGTVFKEASVYGRMQSDFVSSPTSEARRARRGLGYEDLDVKLGAEILRMPFRNFNESTRL